jgi:hypothetical protein
MTSPERDFPQRDFPQRDFPQRDFIGYGANPPDPRWPGGARLALNLVLNFEEASAATSPPNRCSNTAAGSASGACCAS